MSNDLSAMSQPSAGHDAGRFHGLAVTVAPIDVNALWQRVFEAGLAGGDTPCGEDSSRPSTPHARSAAEGAGTGASRRETGASAAGAVASPAARSTDPDPGPRGTTRQGAGGWPSNRTPLPPIEPEVDATRSTGPSEPAPRGGPGRASLPHTAPAVRTVTFALPLGAPATSTSGALDVATPVSGSCEASAPSHAAEAAGETTTRPDATAHGPLNASAKQVTTGECVHIFDTAQGLAVIVRNAHLAAAQAVDCALATAHALSGDRRELTLVVLNGRTVYRNPTTRGPTSGSAALHRLVLSC